MTLNHWRQTSVACLSPIEYNFVPARIQMSVKCANFQLFADHMVHSRDKHSYSKAPNRRQPHHSSRSLQSNMR